MATKIYKKDSYLVVGSNYYPLNSLRFKPNADKSEVEIFELSDINPFINLLFSDIRDEANAVYSSFDVFINSIFIVPNTPSNNGEYYSILQPVIDISHKRIHEGNSYYQNHKRTFSTNNTSDFILKTLDKEVHFGYTIIGTAYQLAMYKINDYANATEVGFLNRDFNGTDLPIGITNITCRQFRNTDQNINIYTLQTADLVNIEQTASSSNRFSVEVGSKEERILKKNSTYLVRITSTTNTNIICSRLDFYTE